MLEPLETWFGYLPYIYIYIIKNIYTHINRYLYLYMALYIYNYNYNYIYIYINVYNIAARTGVRPGEVRFDRGSVFYAFWDVGGRDLVPTRSVVISINGDTR